MSEIFRDRTEGAKARRQDLLRRRRDELVTMPHAIRRVVVARRGRIAAALAGCAGGAALLVAIAKPGLAAWFARGLPGLQPAPLSTLLVGAWLVALAAWSVSRAVAEHRFAVAMSRYVLPGDDLDLDVERLSHEHPDEAARGMAHRLEVVSAALPVAAALALVPATALYVARAVAARGWPTTSMFEADLAGHAGVLVAVAIAGVVASVVMTRRGARVPIVAPIAAGVAVVAAVLAIALHAWWLVATAVIAATFAVIGRRLRIERDRICAEDPAAGSEIFTLRGFLDGARRVAAAVRSHARPLAGAVVLVPLVALGGSSSIIRPPASPEVPQVQPVAPFASAPGRAATYELGAPHDGVIPITIWFRGEQRVEIPVLSGLPMLPAGWQLQVSVLARDARPGSGYALTIAGSASLDVYRGNSRTLTVSACEVPRPAELTVVAPPDQPGDQPVVLDVVPQLSIATCPRAQ